MLILGIDPGFADTGWGVIEKKGNDLSLVDYGVIKTSTKLDFIARLEIIHQDLTRVIKKFKPEKVAVEQLFFAKNVKTALLVGQARGVVLLTIMEEKLPLLEYTPLQVKQAVCSYGRAEKTQIQKMVKVLLQMKDIPRPDDAADALAIAICCANSN
ncbi:MAG: crossover junction endodeoxyribonuclease RuvC [Patescibacteria group bacterium]|jgi:crossover junction endodeoxyribonuclease RuvC